MGLANTGKDSKGKEFPEKKKTKKIKKDLAEPREKGTLIAAPALICPMDSHNKNCMRKELGNPWEGNWPERRERGKFQFSARGVPGRLCS